MLLLLSSGNANILHKFDLIVTASLYIQQLELYKKLTLQAGIFPLKVLRLSWGR